MVSCEYFSYLVVLKSLQNNRRYFTTSKLIQLSATFFVTVLKQVLRGNSFVLYYRVLQNSAFGSFP